MTTNDVDAIEARAVAPTASRRAKLLIIARDVPALCAEVRELRAALERARALVYEWIMEDGETFGAKLMAQMGQRLADTLDPLPDLTLRPRTDAETGSGHVER